MLYSSKQVDNVIEEGSQFLNENPKIVKTISKHISYNDEPKLYGYLVNFKDKFDDGDNDMEGAAGFSFNKNKALLKVIGETIERYSLSGNNDKKFIYKSFSELINLGKSAVDLKNLVIFLDKNHQSTDLENKKLHWVEGKSLISNKIVLVPAQLIYVPYLYQNSETVLRFPISTGAAAGVLLEDALYRGICEVVERDAFMINYLNKLPSPKIDLSSMGDFEINNILRTFNRYKLEVNIFKLTTDLQIPAFAAVTIDKTGLGPSISVGLKAGFDIKEDIIGAIEESLMVRSWVRDKFIYIDLNYKRGEEIISIEDRAHFWFPVSVIKNLDFWLKGKKPEKIKSGLYHYNVKEGSLELLLEGDFKNWIIKNTSDEKWIASASVILIITGVLDRTRIKYGDRGYRYALLEAGHMGQNICLVSTELGLGTCVLGGYIDSEIDKLLDINLQKEFTLYLIAVGKL